MNKSNTGVKITPQQYEGAEHLAERLVNYLEFRIEKAKKATDHYSPVIAASMDSIKWVVLAELKQMLYLVDEELNEQEEYFKNGRVEL